MNPRIHMAEEARQSILQQFCVIKLDDVEVHVDPETYIIPSNFVALKKQMKDLTSQLTQHFPYGFQDLEDDDFFYEDDEYAEILHDD